MYLSKSGLFRVDHTTEMYVLNIDYFIALSDNNVGILLKDAFYVLSL